MEDAYVSRPENTLESGKETGSYSGIIALSIDLIDCLDLRRLAGLKTGFRPEA